MDLEKIVKDYPENLWDLAPENTGIEKSKFIKYSEKKDVGYAIKIGEVKKYKTPKELIDFYVKKAPQSFQYID